MSKSFLLQAEILHLEVPWVYDALISRRVYKEPFSHEKSVAIILEGKGNHFDPDIVDAFMEVSDDFYQISLRYADSEEDVREKINAFR